MDVISQKAPRVGSGPARTPRGAGCCRGRIRPPRARCFALLHVGFLFYFFLLKDYRLYIPSNLQQTLLSVVSILALKEAEKAHGFFFCNNYVYIYFFPSKGFFKSLFTNRGINPPPTRRLCSARLTGRPGSEPRSPCSAPREPGLFSCTMAGRRGSAGSGPRPAPHCSPPMFAETPSTWPSQ